jgi:endonuclease YncB( thermonuclease family)
MFVLLAAAALTGCTVTDGDTIRCGEERIRLLAIQAPDKTSAAGCRRRDPAYVCDNRRAAGSAEHLRALTRGRVLRVEKVRVGAWGRWDSVVYADGINLNCAQIASGHATYWAQYDLRGRIRRECRL